MASSPIYSSVLFRAAGVLGDRVVMVPPGSRWVVRSVDVYANISSLGRVDFFVSELPSGAAFVWFNWASAEQNLKHWRGRQVIEYLSGAGGLRIRNDGSEPCDVSVSGYQLTD